MMTDDPQKNLAAALGRVFLGGGEASLLPTLAGFAVAYLMRPLGAIVFGHVGSLNH